MNFELTEDFVIPDNLCQAALKNGITLICDLTAGNVAITLPDPVTFDSIPIYLVADVIPGSEKATAVYPDAETEDFGIIANSSNQTRVIIAKNGRYIGY